MKRIFFLFCLFQTFIAFSQPRTYSFPEVDSLQKSNRKNVVVFIHTDWCMYCRAMQSTTFMDQDLIALLDERFWFVVFDAEEKKDVPFNGNVYHYKPSGNNTGVNELAEHLGTIENELRYPATCVLNPDYQIIFQYNQFLSPEQLKTILLEVLKNSD